MQSDYAAAIRMGWYESDEGCEAWACCFIRHLRMWRRRFEGTEKLRVQMVHEKGRSPVCELMCSSSDEGRENLLGQNGH